MGPKVMAPHFPRGLSHYKKPMSLFLCVSDITTGNFAGASEEGYQSPTEETVILPVCAIIDTESGLGRYSAKESDRLSAGWFPEKSSSPSLPSP